MKTEERHLPPGTKELDTVSGLPTFTVEESIVMGAFASGKSDKQVSAELRIPLPSFQRLLRNLMEKTGACDRTDIHVWARRQKRCADSRGVETDHIWRRPA
jgi:DNA-binding NarL/FixJ family response regulator